MPNLIVQNLANRRVKVAEGQTLLMALQEAGVDWMHACGGKGRCTTCRLEVTEGMQHFSAITGSEMRYRDNGRLSSTERLACQSTLRYDATGRVPQQTKLPHLAYSDKPDGKHG